MITKTIHLIKKLGLFGFIRVALSRVFYRVYNVLVLRATGVRLGTGVIFEGAVSVFGGKRVAIGDRVRLGTGVFIDAGEAGQVDIGPGSYVGRFATLIAQDAIRIGQDCMISPFCYLIDNDHGIVKGKSLRLQESTVRRIRIGDDVWIGAGSTVLRGVDIADGAVVGAGSVVNRNVPEFTVAAGVPARVVKKRPDPGTPPAAQGR